MSGELQQPGATTRLPRIEPGALDKYFGIAGCLLVVAGAKDWLVSAIGSSTPFWDQWGGEAIIAYEPYFNGTLTLSYLIARHNEHRVFFTRIFSLCMLWLNQYWDPILEMLADSLFHLLSIGLFLSLMMKVLDRRVQVVFCCFVALLYAVPFDWENTLFGFSTHFYLLATFSIAALWLLHTSDAWKPAWLMGVLCTVASYFNISSGAMTAAAGLCLTALQMSFGRRRGMREILGVGLQAVVLAALLNDAMRAPTSPDYVARSFGQFLNAFLIILSWPLSGQLIVTAAMMYAPLLAFAVLTLRDAPAKRDGAWLVLGIGGWVLLQVTALAYGRATSPIASRYFDILMLAVAVNMVCLLAMLNMERLRRNWALKAFAAIWVMWFCISAGKWAITVVPPALAEKYQNNIIETENLSKYLVTGDISVLENKPLLAIPFPDGKQLAEIVSKPSIRAILPPSLFGRTEPAIKPQAPLYRRIATTLVREFKAWCLKMGPRQLPAGLAVFLLYAVLVRPAAQSGPVQREQ